MELAIDTSTNNPGVALSEKGKVMADLTWRTDQNHTVELIPKMIYLMELRHTSIREVKAIAAAQGPGSFNGLRVGLATAKGLAFALGIPLVAIGTLEMEAFAHAGSGLPVCPITSAGRGDIAAAIFQSRNGHWDRLVQEHLTTFDQLCSEITGRTLFCGEIDSEMLKRFKEKLGDKAMLPEVPSISRRVAYLSELGWRRIEKDDFDDVRTVQPMYLKKPSITVPKKRRHDAMSDMRPRL